MAETAVLIIFVLLLMLTVLLGREADRRRDAEQGLERYEELRLLLVERGHDPDAFLDTVRTHRDNWRELVRLDEALDDAGIKSTPETMAQLAEVVQAGRWREHAGADSEDLAAELGRANERIERLQAQAQGGGGTDHPSCWYDDDGTVAYLFDVAMNAEGYVIQPARAPQHERKRASLPLARVRTGRQLDPEQFLDQTKEIYDWSDKRECRFFVRAFDLTALDQKELYKQRMRILESRFYKNANPSGPPPSKDPPTLRETPERR